MGVIETLYKGNLRRCPSCINPIYAGDCEIRATNDAEVPSALVPPGVARQPVPGRNTVLIKEYTVLKKAPSSGSLQQTRARMEPEPLLGDLYTYTMASRICPICNYALPANFESARSLTVAVVGDTTAGKSLYISALIKQLQAGSLMRIDQPLTFTCMTADRENYYTTNYFEPLFNHLRVLPPNQQQVETTHEPLIYKLTVRPTMERPAKTLNLVLYDTSGEDYVVEQRIVQYTRYVLNADAIIFLADPITMPEIVRRLPPNINYGNAPGRPAIYGLNKIIEQVERARGPVHLRSIPVAITLSKSDLLKYLKSITAQYSFMLPHEYRGGLDLRDLEKVNKEVEDFIQQFGDRALLQKARSLRAHFFATSATGYPPDQQGIFPNVEPRRCLDPLLWILYELKVIRSEKVF